MQTAADLAEPNSAIAQLLANEQVACGDLASACGHA